jgi:antitoxin HigA-1
MAADEFAPVSPGEMIKQEFLAEYGLSQNQLAKALRISPNRIADIIANRRRITADTALRLSLYFGNSPEFWMNLQTHYDVKMARRKLKPQDAAPHEPIKLAMRLRGLKEEFCGTSPASYLLLWMTIPSDYRPPLSGPLRRCREITQGGVNHNDFLSDIIRS